MSGGLRDALKILKNKKTERVAEAIDRDLLGVEGLHGINEWGFAAACLPPGSLLREKGQGLRRRGGCVPGRWGGAGPWSAGAQRRR